MYRAISLRANALAKLPRHWYAVKGGEEIEEDDKRLALLGNMNDLLWRCEASLIVSGAAYVQKLDAQTKRSRWLMTSTIETDIDRATGVLRFRRMADRAYDLTPDQLCYIWLPSPFVEIGPGPGPLQVALEDAGLARNMARALSAYFERGMIGPQVIYSEDNAGSMTPGQRDDLKAWLQKVFAGVQRAFQMEVANKKLGKLDLSARIKDSLPDGFQEAASKTIVKDLGVPYSLVFSDAANYATANQDWLNLYDLTVIPDAQRIVSTLNEQFFVPNLGLELYLAPEEMPIYQEDEAQRATALSSLINSGTPPDVAMDILGYDLGEEDEARIRLKALMDAGATYDNARAYILEDADPNEIQRVTRVLDLFAPRLKPVLPVTPIQQLAQLPVAPEQPPTEDISAEMPQDATKADLLKWQTKAIKRLKSGRGAACEFESEAIADSLRGAIAGALETAETPEAVKSIFHQVIEWRGYP